MRNIALMVLMIGLAGCGVDTMSSAATTAVLKKQEMDTGRQTMQQAQQRIDSAVQQMNQRAQRAGDEGIK